MPRKKVIKILKQIKINFEKFLEFNDYNTIDTRIYIKKENKYKKLERYNKLIVLENEVKNCRKCDLGNSRLHTVFGEGSEKAKLMFIGEGPGYEEDHIGIPFVGKSGKLLNNIIASIGFTRKEVYITNIVKCHPMLDKANPDRRNNDRAPYNTEIKNCMYYLNEQIKIINPKIIVTLGKSATKGLLNIKENISTIRGNIKYYQQIMVIPTYHPAALLRNINLKKYVWRDMKKIKKILG
ncbi:MAG: uracil-DNA glycosylase [Endomicrobium sp.]|jgi:DNA polymerase|nr:uracil-DNA glycosylase [Endomicrobium sp.]